MDIETINIDNIMVPFAIAWYDGVEGNGCFSDTLQKDKQNPEFAFFEKFKHVMDQICTRKYKNFTIYLHNYAKFDGYFLNKHLVKLGKVYPIIHNGKIISLKFTHKNGYSVFFKDSYLLLPKSLSELGISFNVTTQKGIFPYLLEDTNYIGPVPDYKYFVGLSLEKYNNYKDSFINKEWNFKDECSNYCRTDCVSLHEIMSKFNELIYKLFKINIFNYPTIF